MSNEHNVRKILHSQLTHSKQLLSILTQHVNVINDPLLYLLSPGIDPQGTLLNSWKVVWVVLSEDGVEFYKKKTDSSPKGMIPLKGATLTSPCQDFGKRTVSQFTNMTNYTEHTL